MEKSFNVLRDRSVGVAEFRRAARIVCSTLMEETKARLEERGVEAKNVVIIIVLRSALAFLDSAIHAFPNAPIGVLGLKRDERTFKPYWYYENLPPISKETSVIVLDPMLATGGSAEAAVERLEKHGADRERMYFVGVIAAPEGISRLQERLPRGNISVAAVDKGLDEYGYIVPGLGDFGDRYFGYSGRALFD